MYKILKQIAGKHKRKMKTKKRKFNNKKEKENFPILVNGNR